MAGTWDLLGWTRRGRAEPTQGANASTLPPLVRPAPTPHHWLTIVVARPGPAHPFPVRGARVVVRPLQPGSPRPGDPLARATTGPDGSVALFLPAGRYVVAAQDGDEARAATITLEHAGRAMLVLESLGRRVRLTLEVTGEDGGPLPNAAIDVRTTPAGTAAARGATDEEGVAHIPLPPGAYEVRVAGTTTRTYLEADTVLRVNALAAHAESPEPAVSRYAQKARAATAYVAPLELAGVREDIWN